MIGIPEADDKGSRMNAHLMICSESCSLSKECKLLCDDEVRVNGVKEQRKNKKREDIQKLKKVGAIRMSNDNIDELIEEIDRRNKLGTDFDIQYDGEGINGD